MDNKYEILLKQHDFGLFLKIFTKKPICVLLLLGFALKKYVNNSCTPYFSGIGPKRFITVLHRVREQLYI